ncbi:putative galactose-3-O-sulfotransferase [Penaeus vannamei]|uniref:Putative galactose-3-O-sulfotransferase n=1 Tax=Penaeus vannamei TaxID=6689 RepID=A0A423SV42_PENVA|nr:putative galactose-3-O-sulfotransferase [Penaeus vannamei]
MNNDSLSPTSVLTSVEEADPTPLEMSSTCPPQRHVMFLKTHKCGSSTVQNVLFRYGLTQNLSFALPLVGSSLKSNEKFMTSMIPESLLPPDGKVDIFAVHSRLNAEEHRRVLAEDAKWVTIVREPASLFESLYTYYGIGRWYKLDLTELTNFPMEKLRALPRFGKTLGNNQMLFDLGFDADLSEAQLRQAIEELDSLFDLVMVAERMDESLVLLRHLLCWSLHDVVVFTKNARGEGARTALDAHTRQRLREMNDADVRLYEHFLAKHRRAVLAFGARRMAREVAALRKLRDRSFEDCGVFRVEGHNPFPKFREYSGLVGAYATASEDEQCQRLVFSEEALLDEAKQRQLSLFEDVGRARQRSGPDV